MVRGGAADTKKAQPTTPMIVFISLELIIHLFYHYFLVVHYIDTRGKTVSVLA